MQFSGAFIAIKVPPKSVRQRDSSSNSDTIKGWIDLCLFQSACRAIYQSHSSCQAASAPNSCFPRVNLVNRNRQAHSGQQAQVSRESSAWKPQPSPRYDLRSRRRGEQRSSASRRHRLAGRTPRRFGQTWRQNTQSRPETVVVHYPFHPYHGQELPVVVVPRHPDGRYIVSLPTGQLRIPGWMLRPTAAVAISSHAVISFDALLSLVELLDSYRRDSEVASILDSTPVKTQSEESGKEASDGTAPAACPRERTEGSSSSSGSRRISQSDDGGDRAGLQDREGRES